MAQKGKITITNMVYGLGAAIVIVGALFKIQHWPFASEILTLGMVVEALVFTYSAFERQKGDLDCLHDLCIDLLTGNGYARDSNPTFHSREIVHIR